MSPRHSWASVVLVVAVAVAASANGPTSRPPRDPSKPKPASPATTDQEKEQAAAPYQNGCPQKCGPPCIVRQRVGRTVCEFKGDDQAKCCDNGPKITDWLTALFTLLLVYVGARIGRRQLDFMAEQNVIAREQNAITQRQADIQEGTLRATANAAEAANTNAIVATRPWLIARPDGPLEGWSFDRLTDNFEAIRLLKVKWSITNYGRSPAWVTAGSAIGFNVVRRPPYPDSPPYGGPTADVELVLGPGDKHTVEANCPISQADHDAIMKRDAAAYEWSVPALMIGGQSYLVFGPSGPKDWTEYT